MNLLTSRRWVWSRGMLSSPLQAEDTSLQTICNRIYLSYCEQGLEGWGSEPNTSKCKRRSYSFSTRILTKLFELKEEVFFFFYIKRVAGMVVLQKLEKVLVHSGDVTMNICFFKVGKRWLYSSHGFLSGSCCSSGKALGYRFDPGCRRGGDFLHTFVFKLFLGSTQPTIKWVPG